MKKAFLSLVLIISVFSILTIIFSFITATSKVYSININNASTTESTLRYGFEPMAINTDFLNKTKSAFISQSADFIEVDLNNMVLNLYKNGQLSLSFTIQSKGRPGSWWETPAGLYKIELKEKTHFSSIGKVYQPWSMGFQGNFFIHGWPYYEGGQETSSKFTGGCIKLNTADAKELYGEVGIGMPVLVFDEENKDDNFAYTQNLPPISSSHYMAADLKNNFIFISKNSTEPILIASLTKLMTALVAAEYINLGKTIVITDKSIATTSIQRLKAGESIEAFELVHLLLEESSNEAANALADYIGRDYFVQLMNKKAKAIGLKDSVFVDPSGVGDGNVSTNEDLFTLAKYIYNNRSFILKISAGQLNTGINRDFSYNAVKNFNEFSDLGDFVGGKVGQTLRAKQTILSVFNIPFKGGEERPIVFISLGSEDRRTDVLNLKKYIEEYFN